MLNEQLIKEAEFLNFRQDRTLDRIVCDDPEIWVENCRGSWQENHKFALVCYGTRIGFAEPASSDELRAEIIAADRKVELSGGDLAETRRTTWVVGQLGVRVVSLDIESGRFVEAAPSYRFKSVNEQDRAVSLIYAALEKDHDFYTDREDEISRVIFSMTLLSKLNSGELLKKEQHRNGSGDPTWLAQKLWFWISGSSRQ